MKRPYLLVSGAWLIHAVSWFLPAALGIRQGQINTGLAGWEAFLVTATAILPDRGRPFEVSFRMLLLISSVLSTVLFVLASPWIVWRGSRRWLYSAAWIAVAGFIVNAQWYVISLADKQSGLGIGYFLWWFSFAVLAVGLFDLARQSEPGVSTPQNRLGNL